MLLCHVGIDITLPTCWHGHCVRYHSLLRASLRMQLAFKDDYEHEIKVSVENHRDNHLAEVQELNQRIEDGRLLNQRLVHLDVLF